MTDAENALAAIAGDIHEALARDPNYCVATGIDRNLDRLPDPSNANFEAEVDEARALLARLARVDPTELDFDAALDHELATLMLEARVHERTRSFNGRTRRAQLPSAADDIGDGIFLQFINDPRSEEERLDSITARIEGVPAYLEALVARLEVPVARWAAMDREKVEGLPELFDTLTGWAREVAWTDLGRIERATATAKNALEDYLQRLGALPTIPNLHLGTAEAERVVEMKGIDKGLDELHAMARDFLAETTATIEMLHAKLAPKYALPDDATPDDLTKQLAKRYAVSLPNGRLEDILDRYQQEREQILAFISERELFPVPDDQDMRILRTPEFMAPSIPAGAMMSPPPFRPGVRTSLVYLTLSEELVAEHTELSIPGMMIHEGIPGHHLQLSTAATHPSLIRRHHDCMHHAEGWTTMLEDYMLDMGYMDGLTDEARFVGKRDISRIGARVAIDLFFMTGEKDFLDVGVDCDLSPDDPFEAAGNLLAAVTGFVPGRVQAELNWYSQERGYPLSYLTGNRMVWELKRDIADAGVVSGLELDRRFHTLYLESGNMPLRLLRKVVRQQGLLG